MSDAEELAIAVAKVIGESSAAAKALRELEQRRAAGQFAWLSMEGSTWLVHGVPSSAGGGQ